MLRDGEGGVDGTALWKEVGMGLVDVASCCWAERVGEAASKPARPMDVIFLSFCLDCASGCESPEKKTPHRNLSSCDCAARRLWERAGAKWGQDSGASPLGAERLGLPVPRLWVWRGRGNLGVFLPGRFFVILFGSGQRGAPGLSHSCRADEVPAAAAPPFPRGFFEVF